MEEILAYIDEAGGENAEYLRRFITETNEQFEGRVRYELDKPVVRLFRTDTEQQVCSLHVPTAAVVFNKGEPS